MPITLHDFVRKWNASLLNERQGAQPHFRDLCDALGVPHPTEVDEIGASYTFEKRVTKAGTGEQGYADVWKRGFFAWEYKSKGSDLGKALKQLNEYHAALDNPPLLIVCDFVHFQVHTKFENLPSRVFAFTLDDLLKPTDTATCALPPLEVLRALFGDYHQLRPGFASVRVTEAAAVDLLRLTERLEMEKPHAPERPSKLDVAHFMMRLVFCLFADSVKILPNGAFRRLIANDRFSPSGFNRKLPALFAAMSEEQGFFGADTIPFFNGGLFKDNKTIQLDLADLAILHNAAQHDWSHIEPAIFGTLFERSLDIDKRSMIGAHYTSPDDILLLVDPVVMAPLIRRWHAVRQSVLEALAEEAAAGAGDLRLTLRRPALMLLQDWAAELSHVTVLDPACGSGNFLYIALKRLLDLWDEARLFGLAHGLAIGLDPMPGPQQLFGIETDFYAHEIASIVVWIGFLQWKVEHGTDDKREPVLNVLDNIQRDDAILRYQDQVYPPGKPYEPVWPVTDFIVSNPPFLGDKKMRAELNIPPHTRYVDDLRRLYAGRVPGGADLVTYWFEKARAMIEAGEVKRAGLLATNSISMVGNRPVLERIEKSGNIFMAWSDRPWVLAGAAVRVSMIGFDNGAEPGHTLDGLPVQQIHADLTGESNVASALPLPENANLCFLGVMKGGPFDITAEEAREMLGRPVNPNGRPNSDVVKRRLGGRDITTHDSGGWIIDFDTLDQGEAALYEWPFEYVKHQVKPLRDLNRDTYMRTNWWRHGRSRPELRRALTGLTRCIVTPEVAKHRLFVWMDTSVIPDHKLHVIARDDDYFFGVLQSHAHELWTLATCSWMGKGNDPSYNSDTTFDTFPFPWPPTAEPTSGPGLAQKEAIAEAARRLVHLRDNWLNPPNTPEADLKKRTLTNLYNERQAGRATWLADAHRALDEAVFAAYGWPADLTTPEILTRLLALNHERSARAAAQPAPSPKPRPRKKPPSPSPAETAPPPA